MWTNRGWIYGSQAGAPVARSGGAGDLPGSPRLILDASDSSSIVLSGSNVTTWTATGTGAVYTGYNNPTFSGTGDTSAIQVGNTNRYFRTPDDRSTSSWHMFAVTTPTAMASDTTAPGYTNDTLYSFAQYGGIRFRNDGGTMRAVGTNYGNNEGFKGVQSTAAVTVGDKIIVDVSLGSGTLGVRVNAADEGTIAANFTVPSNSDTAIGRDLYSGTYTGKIHEIVVYSSVLTGADYTRAIDYLSIKWGV